MNPKEPAPLRQLVLFMPCLVPVVLTVLGWHFLRWPGAIIGSVLGCVICFALWIYGFILMAGVRSRRMKAEMSALPTEALKQIATDPSCREIAYAIMELERRGIKNVRPSIE